MNKDKKALYESYMDIFNAIFTAYEHPKAKELMLLLFRNTEVDTARVIVEGMGLGDELIKAVEKNQETKGGNNEAR